ncbi:MAG TPA: hypothetical protein EYQ75_06515, partial [Planctomycetaceae bacterium]|nr:hypothetical protein [Planctomycetaceae bacterium]
MSARDFLNLLKERSLLDDAIIADLRRQLEESGKSVSAETIAKLLVENEHLTRFQATQLVGETTKDKEARRAKRADNKADQVSGIEVTDDDLLAVKEPEPDSPTPVKPHGTKPKVTLIGCSIFCLFALTFCFVAVLCYAGVRFLMRVDAPAKTPVASYTTPDAATVKKHMTPAQLALGDPAVNSVGMLLVPI